MPVALLWAKMADGAPAATLLPAALYALPAIHAPAHHHPHLQTAPMLQKLQPTISSKMQAALRRAL